MRSQPGEKFELLGMTGQVTACSDSGAFIEFAGQSSLMILTDCEGTHDCVISATLPDWMINESARATIRHKTLAFFELDTELSCSVKLSAVHVDSTNSGTRKQPYVAAVVGEPNRSHGANPYRSPPKQLTMEEIVRTVAPGYRWDHVEPDIYSVPRRFDLASMFSISVAFALLFSIMRALDAPPLLIASFAIFFTSVGVAQAMLFNGNKPREASIIAGLVCGFMLVLWAGYLIGNVMESIPMALCSIIWTPIVGYFVGTINGGIWLITDYLRTWLERRQAHTTEQDDRPGPFDDMVPKHANEETNTTPEQ